MLKALLHDERRTVRIGACEELTLAYWGQDECWNTLDAGDGGDLRCNYGVRPTTMTRRVEQFDRKLAEDPERWVSYFCPTQGPGCVLDELRLMATHKDRRIAARFCAFLKERYGSDMGTACSVQ